MRSLHDRLMSKVKVTANGCWIWTGCLTKKGYGKISLGRRGEGTGKTHRVSWILVNGSIPQGMEVMHNCPGGDDKRCVNPTHLLLGTPKEHGLDRKTKGQMIRGESSKTAKLTNKAVQRIKIRLASKDKLSRIANDEKVARATIQKIANGDSWRHIP